MIKNLIPFISDLLGEVIESTKTLSGGSISSAYLIKTASSKYFLKVNGASNAMKMFHEEQKGLNAIESTNTISVPHVHSVDILDKKAFIMMDYIESKRPTPADYSRLGSALSKLHQTTYNEFGFSTDNFIGSLPQSNKKHTNWSEFYWSERISPQLQLALKEGLLSVDEIPSEDQFKSLFNSLIDEFKPSLLHGDLWGGNYLISTDGTPFLIDPAVYMGHNMVDIAMSQLFGSFGPEFYNSYHTIIERPKYYNEQIDLYQLYYLLVHLNLFGKGYYSSVSTIFSRYFQNSK
jgi:fructosamine-3-kinase